MKATLATGISLTKRLTVDEARCIVFMGRALMVYSTPSMVHDVEYTCLEALLPHLDEGENSVGAQLAIDHLGPTPLGMEVRVDVRLVQLEKRRATFEFSVHDALEQVGRGTHTRFIVDKARTRERIEAKRAQAGMPPAG